MVAGAASQVVANYFNNLEKKMDFSAIDPTVLSKARETVEKRRRARIAVMLTPGIIGFLMFVLGSNVPFFYELPVIGLMATVLIGSAATMGVIVYLNSGFGAAQAKELVSELSRLGVNAVDISNISSPQPQSVEFSDSLKGPELALPFSQLDDQDKIRLAEFVKERVSQYSAAEFAEKFYKDAAEKISKATKFRAIYEDFEVSRKRLLDEIASLERKGNVNLGLGVGITVVGLILLGLTVVYEIQDSQTLIQLASHFLPRLSLVVLIELFAYFFLRLYKSGLAEIKYFQNELTNIEAKQIAMRAAFDAPGNSTVAAVVAKLSDTERNHILAKDQTTVELEKAKLESESKVAFGKFVSDFFQKVKPSS